ncbi:hypothetical protein [Paludibacterium denitrificans]|uniref:hypothetical protein n=1 Tax=Paludibacterium denitrificans TaxID=2675226 RepID=UPI0035E45F32
MAFRQIEFLRLSERRVLMILVTLDGDVQNHLLVMERDYSSSELVEAANFLNQHYAGQGLSHIAHRLETELHQLQGDITGLMTAAIRMGQSALEHPGDAVVVAGRTNLLDVRDLSEDLSRLRELFAVFERKTELLNLLHQGQQAQGVNIFIGDESGVVTLDECSVVTAPYRINGRWWERWAWWARRAWRMSGSSPLSTLPPSWFPVPCPTDCRVPLLGVASFRIMEGEAGLAEHGLLFPQPRRVR